MIDRVALVRWADEQLCRLEQPPAYLLDLSLDVPPNAVVDLSFPDRELTPQEISEMIQLVMASAGDGELPAKTLCAVSDRLASMAPEEQAHLLHWLSDELYLCDCGTKDFATSTKEITKVIEELTARAT